MATIKTLGKSITDTYLDTSEKFLQNFFNEPESQKTQDIIKLLKKKNLPWPIKYHISPQRHTLLNWYQFEKDSSLLEIGAECGAVTGVFINKLTTVACNELSPSRAKVIHNRFQDSKNLTIFVGDINLLKNIEKYDYVTLIGVLEYSGKYSSNLQPYLELLKSAKNLLKDGGHLLLAIENKLGLKYFAGAPEDHTGEVFDSLEGYPQNKDIRTFSKLELTALLNSCGFNKTEFYYPFPDYKMPHIVFSEAGIQELHNHSKSNVLNTLDHSTDLDLFFNEIPLGNSLHDEGIISHFSNSFLIDAYA